MEAGESVAFKVPSIRSSYVFFEKGKHRKRKERDQQSVSDNEQSTLSTCDPQSTFGVPPSGKGGARKRGRGNLTMHAT